MSHSRDPDPDLSLRALLEQHRTARHLILKGASLRGLALPGLRADGLELEEADLSGSVLQGVKWTACRMRGARLDRADLSGAVLRSCDLDEVRAEHARLVGARLENCSACGSRFEGSDLSGAVLTDTDFSRASLRAANLEGASASGADFRGADLREANLRKADLTDVDLRGADLRGTDLSEADLDGVDLRGAELHGAIGDAAALQEARDASSSGMPAEFEGLSRTVAPIVAEVLRAAGEQGVLDPGARDRLRAEAEALRGRVSPSEAPSASAIKAVSRVLSELGPDLVPSLLGALGKVGPGEPPPEVKTLIRRLGRELSLGESATAEDILDRLTRKS